MRHGVRPRPSDRLIRTTPPYSIGDGLERVTTAMTAAARAPGPG
jgi:adenosylmethionine---8-amino-7-oxononanoate aminotransferase